MLPLCVHEQQHNHVLFFQKQICVGCVCLTSTNWGPLGAQSIARLAVAVAANRCIFTVINHEIKKKHIHQLRKNLSESLTQVAVSLELHSQSTMEPML
jgi:hypothetical protein